MTDITSITPQINNPSDPANDPVADLQKEYLKIFNQLLADMGVADAWKQVWAEDLAKLLVMIKEHKDPSQILQFWQQTMMPDLDSNTEAEQNVLSDRLNLNTEFSEFSIHAQALITEGNNLSPQSFAEMISFLQVAQGDIIQGQLQTPPVFGSAGDDMSNQIDNLAQMFSGKNGAGTIHNISQINSNNMSNCYQYFLDQTTPPVVPPGSTPPPVTPTGTLVPAMTQNLSVIKQTVTQISAPIQTRQQFIINQRTQYLAAYTNSMKSFVSFMAAVIKNYQS